ncbi:MAG: hypothetical protein WDZ94_04980 [Patescibacteria group bacterium]
MSERNRGKFGRNFSPRLEEALNNAEEVPSDVSLGDPEGSKVGMQLSPEARLGYTVEQQRVQIALLVQQVQHLQTSVTNLEIEVQELRAGSNTQSTDTQ